MNTTGVQIFENGCKANKSFLNKIEKFFGIKAGKHIKPLEKDAVEINKDMGASESMGDSVVGAFDVHTHQSGDHFVSEEHIKPLDKNADEVSSMFSEPKSMNHSVVGSVDVYSHHSGGHFLTEV